MFIISRINEIRDFVMAVIEDRPQRVDPTDALYALKTAEAVAESIELRFEEKRNEQP